MTDQKLTILSDCRGCTECDLHEQAPGVPKSIGSGARRLGREPPAPAVIYVGRNPGYNEDDQGHPFVGRSGQLLHAVYIDGINLRDRATIYLLNGVRCYTIKDEPPKARHWKSCLPHTMSDLEKIREQHERIALVLLGGDCTSHSYRHLLGVRGMNLTKGINNNGETHDDMTVFSTYHPSAVLRDPNYINAVHDHNGLISAWLDGVMAVPSEPNIIPTRIPHV